MGDIAKNELSSSAMDGMEPTENTTEMRESTEPLKPLSPTPATSQEPHAPKEQEQTSLRLVLPAKLYASHVAQLEKEKPKRSTPNERSSRPTQVPPLVFPLANIFEERTPLSLSSNNASGFGASHLSSGEGPTHSPPFWDPADSASRNGPVACIMYHKIRGGKGEWREVAPWELIRVTKGVGKKVKMVVEAPGRFGPGDVHISLTDMTDQVRTPRTPGNRSSKSSRFIVESTTVGVMDPETGKSSAELIIKLFKLSKQLIFQATVSIQSGSAEAGSVLRGQSSPFGTHNSGKQRRKREKDGDDDDEDDFGAPPGASVVPNSAVTRASNTATNSSASASGGGDSGGSAYPRRRKQPKRHEVDDDTWISHPNPSHGVSGSNNPHHMNGSSSNSSGTTEDLLEQVWPSDDTSGVLQKEMITQVNNRMRDFGNKDLLEEARKRRAGIVVYVACRRSLNQSEDFTTFVYKSENLLKEDAVTMGTPLGRALFIPADERGDSTGVFTLVAAVRTGLQDMMFAPNSGIAAVYDFRREGDHMMKTIPIHPVLLATEPTTVWLIGSFQVDARAVAWLPSPAQQAVAGHHAMAAAAGLMTPSGAGLMTPTTSLMSPTAGYHPHMHPQQVHHAGGGFRLGGMGPFGGGMGGMGGMNAMAAASLGATMNGSAMGVSGTAGAAATATVGTTTSGTSGAANGSSNSGGGANNPPLIPPLPLGAAALGYPHLTVQYSPRGSLHSPSPYYANPATAGYLAPKPMYASGVGGSPAPSPSSTPIPGASSIASGLPLGPPTPGLGQTPRSFGDMLGPFGGQSASMMSSGFYSPLSNASYSQPLYMLDPLLLSARGLGPDHSSGFYSPTSSATSAGSAAGSTTTSLNLSQLKNGAPQQPQAFNQNLNYAYNLFPGASGFQGFPGSSPRLEELLDSGRI
jgi:hypothetical protein